MPIPRRLISFPSCEVLHKVWSFGCLASLWACISRSLGGPFLKRALPELRQGSIGFFGLAAEKLGMVGSQKHQVRGSLFAFSRTHLSSALALSLSLCCHSPSFLLLFVTILPLMPETPDSCSHVLLTLACRQAVSFKRCRGTTTQYARTIE